ncbi:hypothetical protein Tco_0023973 [Tanacetum coccineum]
MNSTFIDVVKDLKTQGVITLNIQTTSPTTPTTTAVTFGDDETIAKVLLNMSQARAMTKEKEKGVELRDVEESERPRPTSTRSVLTLKPLPKIDPKDKGKRGLKKMLNQVLSQKRSLQLRRMQELDDVKARLEADRLLALRLQEEEREKFTIEERAKFLHDTIAAQRRFLAEQRSYAIRSKPPTKTQLRNQMITYLKHVGGKKHADLKNRKFDDIQTLYERIKRDNDRFLEGPLRDVQKITKKKDTQESLKEEKFDKVPAKVDVTEQGTKKRKGGHIKMMARKRSRPQKDDKDDDEIKLSLMIVPDEDKEVDYEVLDRKYHIVEWKSEFHGFKPQHYTSKEIEEIHMNVVIRSNGQRRYFSTLMGVLSILDREDLNDIYQLVMNKYSNDIPEGFDRILWGDLMIMFSQEGINEFWNTQQDWKIVYWKLHNSSGIHTVMTETGLTIHMLVEHRYPLKKEVLLQMLEMKLESEEDNTMALELIRFVKKQIIELEHDNLEGDEK